jgi:hypothetical protein
MTGAVVATPTLPLSSCGHHTTTMLLAAAASRLHP